MHIEPDDKACVERVLRWLDADIRAHPARLGPLPPELLARWNALTDGMDGDPDDPIEGPVALDADPFERQLPGSRLSG